MVTCLCARRLLGIFEGAGVPVQFQLLSKRTITFPVYVTFKRDLFMCLCAHVGGQEKALDPMHTCVQVPWGAGAGEGTGSHGAGVKDGCDLLNVDLGIRIQAFCKDSEPFLQHALDRLCSLSFGHFVTQQRSLMFP